MQNNISVGTYFGNVVAAFLHSYLAIIQILSEMNHIN